MEDRLGYLWLATTNGVLKYNGYEFLKYGINNGIANEDVWYLYEDAKSRIWLSSISDEMGYIKNSIYKKTVIQGAKPPVFYPYYIRETKNGIVFITQNQWESRQALQPYVAVENNDSIYLHVLPVLRIVNTDRWGYVMAWKSVLDYQPQVIGMYMGNLYSLSLTSYRFQKFCNGSDSKLERLMNHFHQVYKHYFISYSVYTNTIHVTDMKNCTTRVVQLFSSNSETIRVLHDCKNRLQIVTNKNVYYFNEEMKLDEKTGLEQILQTSADSIAAIIQVSDSKYWNYPVATTDKGIFIKYKNSDFFNKVESLRGMQYVGNASGKYYLKAQSEKTLYGIDRNGKNIFRTNYNKDIGRIFPYTGERGFIANADSLFLFSKNADIRKDFLGQFRYSRNTGKDETYLNHNFLYQSNGPFIDLVATDSENIYMISRGMGTGHFYIHNDSLYWDVLESRHYEHVAWHPIGCFLIAYNNREIFVYHPGSKKRLYIGRGSLNLLKIRRVDNILIDKKYGNIFLKDHDKLFICDFQTNSCLQILSGFILKDAIVDIRSDKLIVAGKAGVIFCDILGIKSISSSIWRQNVKSHFYENVKDMICLDSFLYLNTDRGTYTVSYPQPKEDSPEISIADYRFVLNYDDTTRLIKEHDTIDLSQENRKLSLDLINSLGVGAVKFSYKVAGTQNEWLGINEKELYFFDLKPGQYYTISIKAEDDVWKSKVITFQVRIVPHWWQKPSGLRALSFLFVALLAGMALLIVHITRRNVAKKHLKKNKLLSLELKAIHSQINPHFIFNTLNTGMYYIQSNRNAEAYEHISSFSSLMRSYLKSSRNKFIMLNEEIENLHNYIRLQQKRFSEKFDYEIKVDDSINIENTLYPTLLTQPLVENAINHGLLPRKTKGRLCIEFKINEGQLICIIDDNGIGRKQSALLKEQEAVKTTSYGTDLVKDLLAIYNTYEKMNIAINYIDKEAGTTVLITITYLP